MKLFHPSKKILSCYIDSELKPRKKKSLESHLSSCNICAKEVNILRTLELSFKEKTNRVPLPYNAYFESYTSRVMEKLEQRTPPGLLERLKTNLTSLTIFDHIPMPTVRTLGLAVSFIFIITFGYWLIETQQIGKLKKETKEITLAEKKVRESGKKEGTKAGEELKLDKEKIEIIHEKKTEPYAGVPPSDIVGFRGSESDKISVSRNGAIKPKEKISVPSPSSPLAGSIAIPTPSEDEFASAGKSKDLKEEKATETATREHEFAKRSEVDRTLKEERVSPETITREQPTLTESELYNAGLEEQKKGRYDYAIKNYNDQLKRFPKGPLSAAAQYQLNVAKTEMTKTSKDTASLRERKRMWQTYLKEYPNSEYSQDARFELANISSEIAHLTNRKEDVDDAVFWNNEFIKREKTIKRRVQAEENLRELKKTSKTR